jgi:hypothetical protein
MQLPFLYEWTTTRQSLHQAAQVIGAVRAAVAEPEPSGTHLGLRVVPEGLTTGKLPDLGVMTLDFTTQAILFDSLDRDPVGFSLARHTQITLAEAVANGLEALGRPIELNYDKLSGEDVFDINPVSAVDYARILAAMNDILGAFRKRLHGKKTPLIVWPHGFDLAFLWFATEVASEKAAHMGFGFSPYSTGLERPHLYTYPYPVPDDLTLLDLPPFTRWYTENWTGTVTDYDHVARQHEPAPIISNVLNEIFNIISPFLSTYE